MNFREWKNFYTGGKRKHYPQEMLWDIFKSATIRYAAPLIRNNAKLEGISKFHRECVDGEMIYPNADNSLEETALTIFALKIGLMNLSFTMNFIPREDNQS